MATFDLVLRTLISEITHCERQSVDWPREMGRVLAAYSDEKLFALMCVIPVLAGEIDQVQKNRASEIDRQGVVPITSSPQ